MMRRSWLPLVLLSALWPMGRALAEPAKGPRVGAGVAVSVLDMPKLSAGPKLWADWKPLFGWPIELSAVFLPDNAAELTLNDLDLAVHPAVVVNHPGTGTRATFQLWQAGLALCPLQLPAEVEMRACAGLRGGIYRVKAEGFIEDGRKRRPSLSADIFARFHHPLGGGIAVSYSLGIYVGLIRDRFTYQDRFGATQELFRAGLVGGRLDLLLTLEP